MQKNLTISIYECIYGVLALAGILISAYLWNITISHDPNIPCTAFSDCEAVLTGEWSKILGVPVAALGFFYYGFMLLLVIQKAVVKHEFINKLFFLNILAGVIFTFYLRYLEFVKIGSICILCWISVVIVLSFVVTFVIEREKTSRG